MSLPRLSLWQRLRSYFAPVNIVSAQSAAGPDLRLEYLSGRWVLNAGRANYSYGGLYDVFEATFGAFPLRGRQLNSGLVLGLGAGGVVAQLRAMEIDAPIIGVEHDPEVVRLAGQYFGLYELPNLSIVQSDAQDFVFADNRTFDIIVVDVFTELEVPKKLESPSFIAALQARLSPNGILFFNRVYETRAQRENTQHFAQLFARFFPMVQLYRVRGNLVLVVDRAT